ncbi:hypothetical protein Gotur_023570, partial [Gossypium turneri]
MAAIRFDIEKFDGVTNFNQWQVQMMVILVQTSLKKLCLTNKVLQEVLMEKISSTLWKMLKTLYTTKSLANCLVLKQCLFKFCMNEGELHRDHISQFITFLNDLKNVEVKVDDEDQAILLLCFLPSSYKSFKETLIYGRDKLSFEDMKSHLLSKEKLDNEFGSDSKANRQASVLVASQKQDKRCCYYKKLGHVKVDCCKLRNKRATESNEEDVIGANLANESNNDFLLVSTSNSSELTFEWILDSGCSFHMCPNRE